MSWIVEWAAGILNWFEVGKDAETAFDDDAVKAGASDRLNPSATAGLWNIFHPLSAKTNT